MLKEKIVIVDVSKKSKIVSEVSKGSIQETFYEKIKLIGQGTFGKVYLVIFALTAGQGQEGWAAVGAQGGAAGPAIQEQRAEHHRASRAQQYHHNEGVLPQVSARRISVRPLRNAISA